MILLENSFLRHHYLFNLIDYDILVLALHLFLQSPLPKAVILKPLVLKYFVKCRLRNPLHPVNKNFHITTLQNINTTMLSDTLFSNAHFET